MLNEAQKTRHLPYLQTVADADVAQLQQKDREYGASWKSRGGVGAFMMLARKWDRLENMVKASRVYQGKDAQGHDHFTEASAYNIFDHVAGSEAERGDAESLLDTLGDLRRYLLLVQAEVIAARPGAVAPGKAEALSNGGHLTVPSPTSDAARLYAADQRDTIDTATIDRSGPEYEEVNDESVPGAQWDSPNRRWVRLRAADIAEPTAFRPVEPNSIMGAS